MNNLEDLDNFLQNENAKFSICFHDFTFKTAEEGAKYLGITLQETTPTLILKVKAQFMAVIICGNSRVSFKKLKQALQVKDVRLARVEEVMAITGAHIGEVSLVNKDLPTLIDKQVLENPNCYGGCGFDKTTLIINTDDLVRITKARVFDFAE